MWSLVDGPHRAVLAVLWKREREEQLDYSKKKKKKRNLNIITSFLLLVSDTLISDPFNFGNVVAVFGARFEHFEASTAHRGNDGSAVSRELVASYFEHAAVLGEPVLGSLAVHAHAELAGAGLDGSS